MVTIVMQTETDDPHVKKIRETFDKCQKIDKDCENCRQYLGSNIDKLLIFFNTGIGGIPLENIVDIDCTDAFIVSIMQKGGYTHNFLYEDIDQVIIKFKNTGDDIITAKQILKYLHDTLNDEDFGESVTYTKEKIIIHADIALQCNIKDENIRKILQDQLQTDITIRR